jgi:hypothetical protein
MAELTNQDFTTYKGVTIYNLRNARTGGSKIQMRNISVTYTPDRWNDKTADAFYGESNIKRVHAMIDWLLADGSPVVDGRIVTTIGQMETCHCGDSALKIEGYWKFMK